MRRYRIGTFYALATAGLYATQEPLSFLAARQLPAAEFVLFTQFALLLSLPLLLAKSASRSDLAAILRRKDSYPRLGVILTISTIGLLLYNFGLGGSHPVIISATLSLAPFWGALAALGIAKVPIPGSILLFLGCLAGAAVGAVVVAWSQSAETNDASSILDALRKGGWVIAIPVPICTTLAATLVGKWFGKYDESAAITANFLFANAVMIPATLALLFWQGRFTSAGGEAILLLIAGTILAASIGRLCYQIALSATGGDNGFVSMFLNLLPALSALVAYSLSFWLPDLRFRPNALYFAGLMLIGTSLLVFSVKSGRVAAGTNRESGVRNSITAKPAIRPDGDS
jgi:hypothetical protein